MVLSNHARKTSHGHGHGHGYQYDGQQGSGTYLTAIGSCPGLEIKHEDFGGELDALPSHEPYGGHHGGSASTSSAFTLPSDPYLPLPSLVIEPPGAETFGARLFPYPSAKSLPSSCNSSHASGSVDGSWVDTPSCYAQSSYASHSDFSHFGGPLTQSPLLTPLSSPFTVSDEFEVYDRGSGSSSSGSLPVPSIEFGTSAMTPYMHKATTPDTMGSSAMDGGAMDWTPTPHQSPIHYPPSPCPSLSAPNTPLLGQLTFGCGSQLQQALTEASPQASPQASPPPPSPCHSRHHSGSHLSVPKFPAASPRRYSDPPHPSPVDWPSTSYLATRDHSPFPPSPASHQRHQQHQHQHQQHHRQQHQQKQKQHQQQRLQHLPAPVLPSANSAVKRQSLPSIRSRTPIVPSLPIGPKRKGVRTKKLAEETRVQARKTRNERTMCLGCRLSKVKCIGDGDKCVRCAAKFVDKGPRVCTKAYFLHHVKTDSTSFLLQFQTYPQRSDGTRRPVTLPTALHLRRFIAQIRELGKTSDLAVSQSGSLLAVLDLDACATYLSGLMEGAPVSSQVMTFAEFITDRMPQTTRNKSWLGCIKHHQHGDQTSSQGHVHDQGNTALDGGLATWVAWDVLPTHVDYSLVTKADNSHRPLEADGEEDLETLQLAARLFTIITRALEVAAYIRLETQLKRDEIVHPDFLQSLGRLLLLLRWRLAWWKRLGTQIPCPDPSLLRRRDIHVRSARQLCLCLYMYYCFYRRARLASENMHAHHGDSGRQGQSSRYPNASRDVVERYAHDESFEGFEQWMVEGDVCFRECGSLRDLMAYY